MSKYCKVNFFDEQILPCTDCGFCKNKSGCSIKGDKFEMITDMVKNADAVIVLSPVYFLSFPSPLKAYCDRLQRFFAERFIRRVLPDGFETAKKGMLAFCCGAQDCFAEETMKKTTKMMFDCINVELSAVWSVFSTDRMEVSDISTAENMNKLKNIWKILL